MDLDVLVLSTLIARVAGQHLVSYRPILHDRLTLGATQDMIEGCGQRISRAVEQMGFLSAPVTKA